MSMNSNVGVYTRAFPKDKYGKEIAYTMNRETFKHYMELKEFKNPAELMDYVGSAEHLLGVVTELHIED